MWRQAVRSYLQRPCPTVTPSGEHDYVAYATCRMDQITGEFDFVKIMKYHSQYWKTTTGSLVVDLFILCAVFYAADCTLTIGFRCMLNTAARISKVTAHQPTEVNVVSQARDGTGLSRQPVGLFGRLRTGVALLKPEEGDAQKESSHSPIARAGTSSGRGILPGDGPGLRPGGDPGRSTSRPTGGGALPFLPPLSRRSAMLSKSAQLNADARDWRSSRTQKPFRSYSIMPTAANMKVRDTLATGKYKSAPISRRAL